MRINVSIDDDHHFHPRMRGKRRQHYRARLIDASFLKRHHTTEYVPMCTDVANFSERRNTFILFAMHDLRDFVFDLDRTGRDVLVHGSV